MATINISGVPWATHKWKPYDGCPRGCDYCYAARDFKRYRHLKPEMKNDFSNVTFFERDFNRPFPKKPALIFMSESTDPEYWGFKNSNRIWGRIADNPQHTFILLTKGELVVGCWFQVFRKLKNLWFGLTINSTKDMHVAKPLGLIPNNVKFLSVEPIKEEIPLGHFDFDSIDWLIVGGQSGPGEKFYPDSTYVHCLVRECRIKKTPLFIKPNLEVKICGRIENYSEEWGAIQQYPEVKK